MTDRVLSFEKYREKFYQEFEEYYSRYPIPVPEAEKMLMEDVYKRQHQYRLHLT